MNDPAASVRIRSSRPSGELPAALRTWCDREYWFARVSMKQAPLRTVPPGESPDNWLLYAGTWARPLLEAAMRANVWEPEAE